MVPQVDEVRAGAGNSKAPKPLRERAVVYRQVAVDLDGDAGDVEEASVLRQSGPPGVSGAAGDGAEVLHLGAVAAVLEEAIDVAPSAGCPELAVGAA